MKKFSEYLEKDGVSPFRKQRNFNEAVNAALDDAGTSFEEHEKQLSRLELEIKALVNQTNALKTQINKLKSVENQHFSFMCSQSDLHDEQFNKCMLESKPECRQSVEEKNIIEAGTGFNSALAECFKAVKNAGDNHELSSEQLEKAGKLFRNTIQDDFKRFHNRYNENVIAVVCTDLTQHCGMEAIRNEAYDIYNMLKRKSKYNIKLVSIEKSVTDMVCRGDIICIPSSKTRECMNRINPVLCIICESTAHVLTANDCGLLMFRSIIRLSGQNPLRDVSENTLAELCHLNDSGMHTYCVQSQTAYNKMVENGFHEPFISYPVIDINKHIYSCRKNAHDLKKFTVGFASSPMTDEQSHHRGIDLLCETVKETTGVEYLILWRNENVEVPDELKKSSHCRIEYGRYDMEKFYSEVDCVLIPYASENFNHSCSVSAIEAMLNGIPVISTEISGISEIVKKFGIGLVANQLPTNLATCCNQLRKQYNSYSNDKLVANLKKFFSENNIVKMAEHEAKKSSVKGTVTLYEWDRLLKKKNKYLVKGHENMKKYYQNSEIAENYTVHRFKKYPQNCFDMMERETINLIISDYYNNSNDLQLLDIACGNGRIVQELIKFGSCKAVDSSEAMLEQVATNLQPTCNQLPTGCNQLATSVCDFILEKCDGNFDVITSFRYIRHFEYKTRKLLYKKIRECLDENGIFVFDVPNRTFELKLKTMNGWGNYNIYDVFFTKEDIIRELQNNGFEVRYIIPVGNALTDRIPDNMTWTVGAVKKI